MSETNEMTKLTCLSLQEAEDAFDILRKAIEDAFDILRKAIEDAHNALSEHYTDGCGVSVCGNKKEALEILGKAKEATE